MRFINDHCKPTQATRTAIRITENELLNHIVDEIGGMTKNRENFNLLEYIAENLCDVIEGDTALSEDLSSVMFDIENLDCEEGFGRTCIGTTLTGVHTFENGLTALCVYAGGDWEYPVFFIVYWDGGNVRGYIPAYGNCYNTIFNTAFYSEDERDGIEDWEKQYRDIGFVGDEKDFRNKTHAYLSIFGKGRTEVGYNFDAITEDINVSIKVEDASPQKCADMYDVELAFETLLSIDAPISNSLSELLTILGEEAPHATQETTVVHSLKITAATLFPDDTMIENARKVFEQSVREVYEKPDDKQDFTITVKSVKFVGITSLKKHEN